MEPDPDEHQHPGEEDIRWDDESIKGRLFPGYNSSFIINVWLFEVFHSINNE